MTMFHSVHAIIARLNTDKLQATHFVVPQPGLLRTVMGDDAFRAALDDRRRWIGENCVDAFYFSDLRDDCGHLAGKSYRFMNEHDAIWFRFRF